MITTKESYVDLLLSNFPIPTLRDKQSYVLREIGDALSSGYKRIILEAPTGFGKSPVAIAMALTLGSSYVCTSTKDLQSQYNREFKFIKKATGRSNFLCDVNVGLKCIQCPSNVPRPCSHDTADFGPCMNEGYICEFKPRQKNYSVSNRGTINERISYNYSNYDTSRFCKYFDQLYTMMAAGNSVLNYSMILSIIERLQPRELLVLDEAHTLELEVVKFRSITINRKKWSKYIPGLHIEDLGDDMKGWVKFLAGLKDKLTDRINLLNELVSEKTKALDEGRGDSKTRSDIKAFTNEMIEVEQDQKKLESVINEIVSDFDNWIVSDIKTDAIPGSVAKVEFKPLSVADRCKKIFDKCKYTLLMSGTINDIGTFGECVGLEPNETKVIQVGSDFPKENRLIHPLNIARLNYAALQRDDVRTSIANTIDKIMKFHHDVKGIIHLTSYDQLKFVRTGLSPENRRRLLETNPEIERDEVIEKHFSSKEPTVLISPSLHLGLDLKDDLSRFQIITKVPYPSMADKWISKKKERSERWYTWQTGLRLVQGYGRSIRSKEDWARTYVLDSMFSNFVGWNRSTLPTWFQESIVWNGT